MEGAWGEEGARRNQVEGNQATVKANEKMHDEGEGERNLFSLSPVGSLLSPVKV